MTTIQPKPSTSTPILPSFFKPKSSTSTPKKTKNKADPQYNGKQRKRSTTLLASTPEIPVNTVQKTDVPSYSFNRKLATVLSFKSHKRQPKHSTDKADPDIHLSKKSTESKETAYQVIVEEQENATRQDTAQQGFPKDGEMYSQSTYHSSVGSLILSESESSTNTFNSNEMNSSTNIVCDTFINSLSTTLEEDPQTAKGLGTEYETIEITVDSDSCDEAGAEKEPRRSDEIVLFTEMLEQGPPHSWASQDVCNAHPNKKKSVLKKKHKAVSKEEEKKRPVSLLQRTRSRKWSASSQEMTKPPVPELPVCKIDPTTFLAGPGASMPTTHCIYKNQKFSLMNKLLESMMYGGYITTHLHVPMDLWYQPSVRLPYIEAKIAASELLIAILEKMTARRNIELNMNTVKNELKTLKQTLNQINDTLMRKLGCHIPTVSSKKQEQENTLPSSNRTSQAIVAWSSKLSKMRFDSTRNVAPNDKQNHLYIKTLIKLFTDAQVLETWDSTLESLLEKAGAREDLVNEAYQSNMACISQFVSIVCGFVMKDYDILLDKWFKRSTYWMTE